MVKIEGNKIKIQKKLFENNFKCDQTKVETSIIIKPLQSGGEKKIIMIKTFAYI